MSWCGVKIFGAAGGGGGGGPSDCGADLNLIVREGPPSPKSLFEAKHPFKENRIFHSRKRSLHTCPRREFIGIPPFPLRPCLPLGLRLRPARIVGNSRGTHPPESALHTCTSCGAGVKLTRDK